MRALTRGRLIGLIILAAVIAVRHADPGAVQLMRMRSFDVLQELFPLPPQEQPIAIVDIDDESLAKIGQWPWPRTIVAQMVDRLTQLGAAVIGFDIVFAEPDRSSPARAAESFVGLDAATKEALARLPSNDTVFAESLRRSRVVLGASVADRALGDTGDPGVKAPLVKIGGDPLRFLVSYPGVVRAIPELENAAAGRGMFTIEPELDGIYRRVPLVLAIGHDLFPALTFDMLRVATGESVAVRTAPEGIEDVLVGQYSIPTDDQGRVWVRFSHHDPKLVISAKDLLDGNVDPERVHDKFVFIGSSYTGYNDIKATPLDNALPGVEVHAQLLETILSGSYLTRPGWADGAEIFLIGATGLLMIILVPITGARWTLLVLGLIAAAIVAGTVYFYVYQSFLLDGSLSLATAAALYTILVYANYSREQNQRRQIRSAFAQYVSPAYVERIAADPSLLKLGGEHRNMTFLFCDIRSFTAISERYRDDPGSLTRLINRYMTPMTNTIQVDHRGTIDKYIGDCIMAFWNAPLDDTEHARNACRAAFSMLRELAALNEVLAAEAAEGEARQRVEEAANGGTLVHRRVFTKRLDIGIGINTGDCIVGNMGSDMRFGYTVLGDAVNLASRLEGQSKNYGVVIVIGEDTERHVPDFATLELDLIAVKGRAEAVHIFTLLGDQEIAATEAYKALRELHDAMLRAYRAQDWPGARTLIAECRAHDGRLQHLYDLYEARIAAFEIEPPPEGWSGIYVAESK
ncbi:MAG: adenylate/guanylate cyclase domain-containing protein [Alphaproteobacteria bacterium]|nr:adenylate/guanylate cyclase domain-containing protein [Alphaproteobacteria bacterium]